MKRMTLCLILAAVTGCQKPAPLPESLSQPTPVAQQAVTPPPATEKRLGEAVRLPPDGK